MQREFLDQHLQLHIGPVRPNVHDGFRHRHGVSESKARGRHEDSSQAPAE